MAFANVSDGFLYTPGLYATTDGGRTWVGQSLGDIRALTIDGDYAYALTGYNGDGPQQLYRSRIGGSVWDPLRLPAVAGPVQGWQVAAAGPNIVLLEAGSPSAGITASQLGGVWTSDDHGDGWQARPMPCTVSDGGAAVVSVALGHPDAWLLDCYNNRQSSQLQNTLQHLYGTSNAGRTWVRLSDPPQHNAPGLMADNGSGHAFIATQGGADTLNATLDGGRNWTVQLLDGGSFYSWADLQFVSSNTGFVVGPTHYAPQHLYRTDDGGQTWHPLTVTATT